MASILRPFAPVRLYSHRRAPRHENDHVARAIVKRWRRESAAEAARIAARKALKEAGEAWPADPPGDHLRKPGDKSIAWKDLLQLPTDTIPDASAIEPMADVAFDPLEPAGDEAFEEQESILEEQEATAVVAQEATPVVEQEAIPAEAPPDPLADEAFDPHTHELRSLSKALGKTVTIRQADALKSRRIYASNPDEGGNPDLAYLVSVPYGETAPPPPEPEWNLKANYQHAVDKLSLREEQALTLACQGGLTYAAAAERMGISPETLKTYLKTGRAKLMKATGDKPLGRPRGAGIFSKISCEAA